MISNSFNWNFSWNTINAQNNVFLCKKEIGYELFERGVSKINVYFYQNRIEYRIFTKDPEMAANIRELRQTLIHKVEILDFNDNPGIVGFTIKPPEASKRTPQAMKILAQLAGYDESIKSVVDHLFEKIILARPDLRSKIQVCKSGIGRAFPFNQLPEEVIKEILKNLV